MHMLKPEVADKLTELLTPMEGKRILEIGTGWAESAEFFSRLKPEWKIYTIDGFGLYGDGRIYPRLEHEDVLKINKKIQHCGNVIQILGDSSAIPWELPLDLLFIDGDHSHDGCLRDFLAFHKWVRTGGLICFDDYTQENNPLNGVKKVVDVITVAMKNQYEIIHKGYYSAIFKKL
jgi:predicted O-methyltransferase YrrM